MTRIIAIVVLLCAVVLGSYWMGGRKDRLQDEIDILDTEERINEGIGANANCGWYDRLHKTCP